MDEHIEKVTATKPINKETVMNWPKCYECRYFNGGDSTCEYSGAHVDSEHDACSHYA